MCNESRNAECRMSNVERGRSFGIRNSSFYVLLCLGLMPAGGARCLAADSPLPLAPAARVPAEIEAAHTASPPEPQARAKPAAKRGTLADAIIKAFVGDPVAEQRQAQAAQEQQLQAKEAECRPQFQQSLYIELTFLRRVCKPEAKVFLDVAKAAQMELHAPLRKYVRAVYAPEIQGNVVREPGQAPPTPDDPRSAVQKMLLPLAERKMGPEKALLYRQECDKRAGARKHAAIVNLVAALDERLVLTAAQRAKLVDSLSAKYDKSWEQHFEMLGDQYWNLPRVPEQSILPLLDAKQKNVWQETVKPSGEEWSVDLVDTMEIDDVGEVAELQEIAKMVEGVKDGR